MEAVEQGQIALSAAAEEEVGGNRALVECAQEKRKGGRADSAGDDGDARAVSEAVDRKSVAQGSEEPDFGSLNELFERGRSGADRLDEKLDFARLGACIGHRIGTAQVRAHPPRDLQHHELSRLDCRSEGRG